MTKALAARRPGAQSGFTMIELTVALLAGLIVATGIVALSREATNTFHEEARSSAAEAALRGAIDRLRADIQRAGFMSTGNITLDPMIAKAPGQPNVVGNAVKLLPHLQSIHMVSQGSTDTTTMPLSGTNSPRALDPISFAKTGLCSDLMLNSTLLQCGGVLMDKNKPTVAVYKFSSCDGCQLSLLNMEDDLLSLADAVDLAYFIEASRRPSLVLMTLLWLKDQ